jgi:hypothetical protein
MLVLLSDLHITNESTTNNVNPEASELLGAEVLEVAARRGARVTHLVLLETSSIWCAAACVVSSSLARRGSVRICNQPGGRAWSAGTGAYEGRS